MAAYTLLSSYSTVQVLSPTVVNDILYCTIQTQPSSVVAQYPLDATLFTADSGGYLLTGYAESIESVMAYPEVIAGVGSQVIDQSGLLTDNVTFTVQYVAANTPPSGVTADVDVPATLLDFGEEYAGATNENSVKALLNAAVASLKNAANG